MFADLALTCSTAGSVLGAFTNVSSSALSGSSLTTELGSSASLSNFTQERFYLVDMDRHGLSSLASLELYSHWRRRVDNNEGASILPLLFVLASDKFARIVVVYRLAFLVLFGSYPYAAMPCVALGRSPKSGSRLFISNFHPLPHALYVVVVGLA